MPAIVTAPPWRGFPPTAAPGANVTHKRGQFARDDQREHNGFPSYDAGFYRCSPVSAASDERFFSHRSAYLLPPSPSRSPVFVSLVSLVHHLDRYRRSKSKSMPAYPHILSPRFSPPNRIPFSLLADDAKIERNGTQRGSILPSPPSSGRGIWEGAASGWDNIGW